MVGFGLCGAWAVGLAALRAERIAVAATYGGRGTSPRNRSKYIRKINGFVRIPCPSGRSSSRVGLLEMALSQAGGPLDAEVHGGEPDWTGLVDLLDRAVRIREPIIVDGTGSRVGPA